MAWTDLFTGTTPDKLEARGDRLLAAGQWGQARLIFERARTKLERTGAPSDAPLRRLEAKIRQACESLAREHRDTAVSYWEGGYFQEARERLQLALEISRDADLRRELAEALNRLDPGAADESARDLANAEATPPLIARAAIDTPTASRNEHFQALCNTLPEPVARAYRTYGDDFTDGYLALNEGDFETAVSLLERALEAAERADTFIPLELATAYLHAGRMAEARRLLESFRRRHPDVLPACELLCEIYWEEMDFDQAYALVSSLPPDLAQTRAGLLLKGRTLHRSGDYRAARDFFNACIGAYGWDARTAIELARAHEALEENGEALGVYRNLIERCRGCRQKVDPLIQHRYAELAFAGGERSDNLLEIYLALAREVPRQAATYFDRIAEIYRARRNTAESERFRRFARRARAEQGDPPA